MMVDFLIFCGLVALTLIFVMVLGWLLDKTGWIE